jgi:hypothetical protein
MAEMNNYITLDGKKYKTPSKLWQPYGDKPATVKKTLLGATDITYGPAVFKEWRGQIEAPVTAEDASWGTIDDLRTTLAKLEHVTFADHYGAGYMAHVLGPFQERSLASKWDSPSNVIYVQVRIVAE